MTSKDAKKDFGNIAVILFITTMLELSLLGKSFSAKYEMARISRDYRDKLAMCKWMTVTNSITLFKEGNTLSI